MSYIFPKRSMFTLSPNTGMVLRQGRLPRILEVSIQIQQEQLKCRNEPLAAGLL